MHCQETRIEDCTGTKTSSESLDLGKEH